MKERTDRRSPRIRKPSTKRTVTFEYFDPEATVVTLVGDFNGWDPQRRPLKRDAGGLWKGRVRLEPGRYQYKFVINGHRWEEDPLNLQRVPNEHGTFNSVRTVGSNDATAGASRPHTGAGHAEQGEAR